MHSLILLLLLIWAILKWFLYWLSVQAILLYFAECGMELPDEQEIQKYRLKVARKSLGIKED